MEKRSRFLRRLITINPSEEIRFGLADCAVIGCFLLLVVSLICVLAK